MKNPELEGLLLPKSCRHCRNGGDPTECGCAKEGEPTLADDIATLRELADSAGLRPSAGLCQDARDALQRLSAELARLRAEVARGRRPRGEVSVP